VQLIFTILLEKNGEKTCIICAFAGGRGVFPAKIGHICGIKTFQHKKVTGGMRYTEAFFFKISKV
jgi:hypothetical protein